MNTKCSGSNNIYLVRKNRHDVPVCITRCLNAAYTIITDCGNDTYIVNGIANFTDSETTYGQFVPIICNTGYELTGGTGMVCLQDGMWSTYATCKLIGKASAFIAVLIKLSPKLP